MIWIKKKVTASVDRIDSSKGYTKDNVQIIHKHINLLKMAWDEKYLYKMCNAISQQRKDLKNRILVWKSDIFNDTEYPIFVDI